MSPKADSDVFRLLVEGVGDYAIFMLDTKGIVTSWNAGAQRIKGYAADEIIGSHFSRFYTPEALATGWPAEELRRAQEAGRFEDEGWRVRRDGSRFWANVNITALRDPHGQLLGYAKITRDLTERRRDEERLRESEENFRLLVEGARDHAIFLLDAAGCVVNWNAGAERVHGYGADAILGRSFSLFYRTEDLAAGKPQRDLDIALAVGHVEDTGWRVRANGELFWADVTLTALRGEGGDVRGFANVTRDVSERRRVEKLETEGRRMNEFIAMLAHELRNPLAPIRSAVDVMAREATSPGIAWCREMIGRQVEHLARFVDDLLDVSRITSGKIRLEREHLELGALLRSALGSARATLEEYGHTMEVALPDQPVRVVGDQTRLQQAIVNLVTNAAKYTPRGGLLQIGLEQRGEFARISVRDSGIGMSEELTRTAFDLFVQGERALDRPEGGLGIGLTLVKRIVALHRGTVSAASAGAGQGTEMVVSLPLAKEAPSVAESEALPEADAPLRILVVDDNVDAVTTLAMLLSLSGHLPKVALDGAEALDVASEFHPDLILLDIGLPEMDGYEVARRVRQLPSLAHTRLIAVTGYGQPSDREAASNAGFDGHLVKPVDYAELVKTIAALKCSQVQ